MKSAYELAMERLAGSEPVTKLSDEQKARLADVEEKYRAKTAEREVFLQDLVTKALAKGDPSEVVQLEEQLSREKRKFADSAKREKDAIRAEAEQAS